MEELIMTIVELLIGGVTGILGSHLLTWLKYLGVGDEDAARLSGTFLDLISQVIAVGLPILIMGFIGPALGGLTNPFLQIVIVILGSVFGLNGYFLARKKAGLKA
jgi:hypothetical protein